MSNLQQHSKSAQNNVTNDGNANNISNNTSGSDNQQTTSKTLDETLLNGNDASNFNGNYQQKHLEDWLNATMKASPKTFSVSSAEFLDGTNRSTLNANGIGPSLVAPTLNMFRMNPTQVWQIKQLRISFSLSIIRSVLFILSISNYLFFSFFSLKIHIRLVITWSQCIIRHQISCNHRAHQSYSGRILLVCRQLLVWMPIQIRISHPMTYSMAWIIDSKTIKNAICWLLCIYQRANNKIFNSFSDPCLVNGVEEDIRQNGDDKTRMKNQSDNNKLMATLIKQINVLHETNSKICRNLSDTKGKHE